MKSPPQKAELDLDMGRAFRLTPEESALLGELGPPRMTMEEYFDFLARCPPRSLEELRDKPGPQGAPFRLER